MDMQTTINNATNKVNSVMALARFCKSLTSEPSFRDVFEAIQNEETDFEVDGVRFIHTDHIDQIQQEELLSDTYILGCFNADFLSGHLPWDTDTIRDLQDKEQFEAIGALVAQNIEAIQAEYSGLDGYGHHFNRYDGSEWEFGDYLVFDNRN